MSLTVRHFKPGEEVDSWCSKCKDMRLHKVKDVAPGRPVRVICQTCQAEHNLKEEPPGSKTKEKEKDASAAPKKTKSRKEKDSAEDYTRQWLQWRDAHLPEKLEKARVYQLSSSFSKDEIIHHSKFGPGYVKEILDGHKMVVCFEDKQRIMIYNQP